MCLYAIYNISQSTIISVFLWFVVILVCFVVSVFAHLARQHMSLAHAPQCALMFDFSPLYVFKCVLNCAPMCTCVSALCVFLKCAHSPPCALMFDFSAQCVFLKCAHAPMFTHSHGSQYSFTAQLDLGCFLSISFFCLSLVFHLYKC